MALTDHEGVPQNQPASSGETSLAPPQRIITDVTDPRSPLAFAARDLEAGLFVETGYATEPGEIHTEYAPYLDSSRFETVEEGGELVGMVRIITNGPAGFKTLNDARAGRLEITDEGWALLEPIDPNRMAEVGAVAIAESHRGRDDARALTDAYGAIRKFSEEHGVDFLVASMDEKYYKTFSFVFGDTITPLGPMVEYMGSRTIPLLMRPIEMVDSLRDREGFEGLYSQIMAAQERVV